MILFRKFIQRQTTRKRHKIELFYNGGLYSGIIMIYQWCHFQLLNDP